MKNKQESIFSSKTLNYFLQLTETMNYTQASQLLGITQPALTQQIKKLERSVGTKLFYVVGKRLQLTDAGYIMMNATNKIYDVLYQANDDIQQTTSATQGEIKVGILVSVDSSIFDDFAIQYYWENPKVKITFIMLTHKELWDHLEKNKIDLAIMYLPDNSIKNWQSYDSKHILSDHLLFIHHDDSLNQKKKIRYTDIPKSPWVTYPTNYYLNQIIHNSFKKNNVEFPDNVAQFTSHQQLLQFSMKTGAYAALPNSFMIGNGEQKNTWTSMFEPNIIFNLAFVFRRGKDKIPRISYFLAGFNHYLNKNDYLSRLQDL